MTEEEKEILLKIKDKYNSIYIFFDLWDKVLNDKSLSMHEKHIMYIKAIKEQPTATENAKEIGSLLEKFK